jgi:hypothetical protein
MMNTQTLILAAVIITATVALAIAPILLTASADQPRRCFHKGTGEEIPCGDVKGKNSNNCNPSGKNDCHD